MPGDKGTYFGWMTALALAALALIGFEIGRSPTFSASESRSEHAQPAIHVPPDITVVVAAETRIFHIPGCRFIHDKHPRTTTAGEAVRDGYSPCPRCLRQYLSATLSLPLVHKNNAAELQEGKEQVGRPYR